MNHVPRQDVLCIAVIVSQGITAFPSLIVAESWRCLDEEALYLPCSTQILWEDQEPKFPFLNPPLTSTVAACPGLRRVPRTLATLATISVQFWLKVIKHVTSKEWLGIALRIQQYLLGPCVVERLHMCIWKKPIIFSREESLLWLKSNLPTFLKVMEWKHGSLVWGCWPLRLALSKQGVQTWQSSSLYTAVDKYSILWYNIGIENCW